MTREEAIKILKAIRVYECYPKSASEETKEAIDMAIKALKGADDDLISRQDAIEVLTETIAPPSVTLDTLVMRIDALPSAEAVEEWIPVSERLPEDIRPVIITWKNTDPASYYQYIVGKHFIGTGHYCNGKWYWYSSVCEDLLAEYGKSDIDEMDEAIEVVAWMPLPEPYREDGEA